MFVFPDIAYVAEEDIQKMNSNDKYLSKIAFEYDLSWQLIQSGYINNTKTYTSFKKLPIEDEYVFLKRNFSSFWLLYVFLIRLFSFKNPFKEYKSFKNCKSIKRLKYSNQKYNQKSYVTFKSDLINQNPVVSVIIPTLNRYIYLKDVLKDLEKQTYKNFEVIVVDQTDPFQEDFYKGWNLDLKFWYQSEKALWKARNEAIISSKGEYVLLYDDDSLVDENWMEGHLKTLDFFQADISSGISISAVGDTIPDNYSYFKISDQLDTGNVLIKKEVFKTIGLFDRQFEKQRMGDGEYGLRAFLEGFKNISNPEAKRLHLKVGTGGLRQMGLWDGFRPKRWFDPRPIPSVLYLYRKYYGNSKAKYSLLKSVPLSLVSYEKKGNKKALMLAYISLIFIWPLILIQVLRSWKLSGQKLQQGELIEKL